MPRITENLDDGHVYHTGLLEHNHEVFLFEARDNPRYHDFLGTVREAYPQAKGMLSFSNNTIRDWETDNSVSLITAPAELGRGKRGIQLLEPFTPDGRGGGVIGVVYTDARFYGFREAILMAKIVLSSGLLQEYGLNAN
jgi:hypothetical protein